MVFGAAIFLLYLASQNPNPITRPIYNGNEIPKDLFQKNKSNPHEIIKTISKVFLGFLNIYFLFAS